MMTVRDDYLTPEAIELIERARAMAPRLAARARAAEDALMVPRETVAEMQEAGFFKVLQPKRWGGYEMDPRVFYTVQMALAEGCMATAWIYGVIGVHNWQIPLFPEQAQIDVNQGRPSLTLLRALIAQEPLLAANAKQKNIDATWQALSSMTQEQAQALVINADENVLQGWLDRNHQPA